MTKPRPHILYVITDLELGGVPLHLYRLAIAMHARGLSSTVVSLAPAGPVGTMLSDAGVTVRSCDGRGGRDIRVIWRLARLIRDVQPGLVHTFLFHANIAARLAAWWIAYPRERLVCEIQTVEVERPWHLTLDRWTHRACRFTIGNSPSVVEHLVTAARIPRDRLRLVCGGIDPARIRSATPADPASLGVRPGGRVVLWAGRLDPVKGVDRLLDAVAGLSPSLNVHLVLAGRGSEEGALRSRVRRLGLASRVQFLGPRADVPSLLKAADVFAFPSRTEGLPNALLEAMAAGCPIVTTDVPGCRDLIEDGRSGLLVPFGDGPALGRAIERLLKDRELGQALGSEATRQVTERWHIEQTYDAYQGVYRSALSSS